MTMAVTVFFIFVTPIDTLAVAVAPEFYSNLISPLAQTAALYSGEYGLAIPSTLPMDTYTIIDSSSSSSSTDMTTDNAAAATATVATFAGGCFWGLELAYQREPGVFATCVGYTQGDDDDDSSAAAATYPTYAQVCSETTGHTEAVLVVFDPVQVNYAKLANVLFDRIPDPTMLHRVGKDRGTQYRTGMYAHSQEQLVDAQTAFDRENRSWMVSGRAVVTEVAMARTFWPAEEQHQRYLEKGGRFGRSQSAEKGIVEEIRCYG